jgi:hypothetical protein
LNCSQEVVSVRPNHENQNVANALVTAAKQTALVLLMFIIFLHVNYHVFIFEVFKALELVQFRETFQLDLRNKRVHNIYNEGILVFEDIIPHKILLMCLKAGLAAHSFLKVDHFLDLLELFVHNLAP